MAVAVAVAVDASVKPTTHLLVLCECTRKLDWILDGGQSDPTARLASFGGGNAGLEDNSSVRIKRATLARVEDRVVLHARDGSNDGVNRPPARLENLSTSLECCLEGIVVHLWLAGKRVAVDQTARQ